ncbi:MAG: PAS domain S-box protein [Desulfuromonas sp.]|nr:PAS domain S-box protein [Desulfuromonas sp.]
MADGRARSGQTEPGTIVAGRAVRPIEAFALLLLVIFTTELAVMEIFDPLFKQLGTVGAAIADALLLVVISAIPQKIIFSPLYAGRLQHDQAARRALSVIFVQLACSFFVAELLVMLFLPGMMSGVNPVLIGLADAGMTALLSAPLLWRLLARLGRSHRRVTFADLLESPLLLYLLLLYVIFLSDLLQELVVPDTFATTYHGPSHIADALLLTLIISPFLWLFVARPLRRSIQSERTRARAIYEQVIDAVVLADAEGRITAQNPAAQRIFGYAEAELVGRPLGELFADRQRAVASLIQAVTDNAAGGSEVSREMAGLRRNGDNLTMDVSVSRILFAGRENLLLIMRDISERREAERALRESDLRFRQMYEQSEDAILFFKPGSTYVVDANPTAEQLFGRERAEVLGHGLEQLFRGEHYLRVSDAIRGLRPGDALQLENVIGLCAEGNECIFTLRAKIMSLQGVELVYCTLRDITERVRMEQEARDIQARLIQANKMTTLGMLVSGVAHELNNPNNFIMTNAQLLSAAWQDSRKIMDEYYRENGDFLAGGIPYSELGNQVKPLLDSIVDGARRISQIVGNLKQFVRPDQGGIEGEVDVNQMVSSAVAILQRELVLYTENFRCELANEQPRVRGNSQQLGQVILNLLMNACQALPTRQHGIRLATAVDPATAQVIITVRDEGCGITVENGRQIMEPFFTTKLDSGGTGLGLWICRSIIAEHHGSLEFVSTPGAGTTFTVTIPSAPAAAQDGNA